MKFLFPILFLIAASYPVAWAIDLMPLVGLSGEALKNALAQQAYPQKVIGNALGADGYLVVMRETSSDASGSGYLNRFSSEPLPYYEENHSTDAVAVNVVSPEWWKTSNSYGNLLGCDLHNLWMAPSGVAAIKSIYPPGPVSEPVFNNGYWSVGKGWLATSEFNFWQPPKGYEGDVARILMYMLTVYPEMVRFGEPELFGYLTGNLYPSFSENAIDVLLQWHRDDPVSDFERCLSAAIAMRQGNENPYIEHPELVEYLWGNKRGECYALQTDEPEEPTGELRGEYLLSDEWIFLCSPYVPGDAQWSLDGTALPEGTTKLKPADIGAGTHLLEFRCESQHGSLYILIR